MDVKHQEKSASKRPTRTILGYQLLPTSSWLTVQHKKKGERRARFLFDLAADSVLRHGKCVGTVVAVGCNGRLWLSAERLLDPMAK